MLWQFLFYNSSNCISIKMKIEKIHNKGNHLILDGYSELCLDDTDFIEKFLIELTKKIGMIAISKPLVLYHEASDENESGVTGTIILAESNITIHTYPFKNFFCLDVFSCNEFNIEKTISYLRNVLKLKDFKKQLIKRGLY